MVVNIYKYTKKDKDIVFKSKVSIPSYKGDILLLWCSKYFDEQIIEPFIFISGNDIIHILDKLNKVINESDIQKKRIKAVYYFPVEYNWKYEILSDEYFDALNDLFHALKFLSGIFSDNLNKHFDALYNQNFLITEDW